MVHEIVYFLAYFGGTIHKQVYFAFMNLYLLHRKWSTMKSPFLKISLGTNFLYSNQVYVARPCFSISWVLLVIRAINQV